MRFDTTDITTTGAAILFIAFCVFLIVSVITTANRNAKLHEDWVAQCVEDATVEIRRVDPYAAVNRAGLEQQCEVKWQAEIWPHIQQAQKANVHYVITN